jgi:hypothetical protein
MILWFCTLGIFQSVFQDEMTRTHQPKYERTDPLSSGYQILLLSITDIVRALQSLSLVFQSVPQDKTMETHTAKK